MRRKDKSLAERAVVDEIIRKAAVCRLAMADGGEPYLVPLSFGYDGECLYFHSAAEGKKIDILRKNPRVWFEFDSVGRLLPSADGACGWTVEYESVMGAGRAVMLSGREEKQRGLDILMSHYAPGDVFDYRPEMIDRIAVFRVDIESVSGKRSPARRAEKTDG